MICLDSSILIDYLDGAQYVEAFLESTTEPIAVPRIVRYELYVGALERSAPSETIGAVDQALGWTQPLEFTGSAAKEAAMVRAAMLDDGAPIGAADTLIAGIAREAGATLVTPDSDFEQVPQLQVSILDPEH